MSYKFNTQLIYKNHKKSKVKTFACCSFLWNTNKDLAKAKYLVYFPIVKDPESPAVRKYLDWLRGLCPEVCIPCSTELTKKGAKIPMNLPVARVQSILRFLRMVDEEFFIFRRFSEKQLDDIVFNEMDTHTFLSHLFCFSFYSPHYTAYKNHYQNETYSAHNTVLCLYPDLIKDVEYLIGEQQSRTFREIHDIHIRQQKKPTGYYWGENILRKESNGKEKETIYASNYGEWSIHAKTIESLNSGNPPSELFNR